MESNIPDESQIASLLVYGRAGNGKSTFLNHLFYSEDEVKQGTKSGSLIFTSKAGSASCTRTIKIHTGRIHGSDTWIKVFDTPGTFASDMIFDDWKRILDKEIGTTKFSAILWIVNLKDRKTAFDDFTIHTFNFLFTDFDARHLIAVFTHCDFIEDEEEGQSLRDMAMKWIESVQQTLKAKNDQLMISTNLVFFGKRLGELYTKPNYRAELILSLEDLPKKVGVNPIQSELLMLNVLKEMSIRMHLWKSSKY